MKPDIFVTDEIDIDKDLQSIVDATNSGVKVLATIHSNNITQLKQKRGFEKIIADKLFDRYVILSDSEGPGTLTHIYDGNLKCIFCR
jgi:stage III sporulation protein AA